MRWFLTNLLPILTLAACAATPYPLPLDTGHRLTLHRAYGPLPNYTRIYFQNGMRIDKREVDKWTTWCELYVFDSTRGANYRTALEPGEFSISRVQIRYHSADGPLYFPTLGFSFGLGHDSDDFRPPDFYLYTVTLRLASPEQPDLRSLTCQRKWGARGNHFPTLTEMRRALGDTATLSAPVE